jgi:CheY-like chemotaxis protein
MSSNFSANDEATVPEKPGTPLFLTVDDEPDINWVLGRLITQRGFPVHHALCGHEALELSQLHRYCGIFIDAKLPDIEGPQLIELLRQVQQSPCIILISGYFFPDDLAVKQATQTGQIQGFISKPFLHEEILALVDRIAAQCS